MEVQERGLFSPTAGRLIPGSITLGRRPVRVDIKGMDVVTAHIKGVDVAVGCIIGSWSDGDRGWWVGMKTSNRGILGLLACFQF